MTLYRRLLDWVWPPCPRGGHRLRNALVITADGRHYCWHPDCRNAVLAEHRDCAHRWARIDGSRDGRVSHCRCVKCGAHRVT